MILLELFFALLAIVFIASPLYLLLSALSNQRKTDRDFEKYKPKVDK